MRLPFHRTPRPVSQGHTRAFLLTLGAAGIAVAALLAWVGINAPNNIPGRSYYNLKAQFSEADNLTSHYQVRIAGRLVGQVLEPKVSDGQAVVDLQLEGDLAPLRSDTTMRVRPRSAIGVRFVELVPGTRGRPLGEGETIPARQTSASLPLDTVLGTLDAPTRGRTKSLLRALGGGFAGRGEDLEETIGRTPEVLRATGRLAGTIADRPGAAQGFVRGTASAADAADPVREDIARGFDPGRRALAPLRDARPAVIRLLQTAPGALEGTRAGLAATSPFLREASGLAHDALPALDAAPSSLRRATALLRDGRAGINGLDRTLTLARNAVSPTLGLLRTLQPRLGTIDEAMADGLPIVRELAPRRCDIVTMVRNWESMLGWGTETGNYLRFNLQADAESFTGQQGRGGLGPIHSNPYPAPCAVGRDAERLGGLPG
jgi:virulence factor Mce-like protein